METHIQQCQNCKSDNLKNILAREPGESDKVYVQCQNCEEFVASYVIQPQGYYHHRKGYESFLRGIYRSGQFMSGSRIKRLFLEHKNDEIDGFKEVLRLLEERDK